MTNKTKVSAALPGDLQMKNDKTRVDIKKNQSVPIQTYVLPGTSKDKIALAKKFLAQTVSDETNLNNAKNNNGVVANIWDTHKTHFGGLLSRFNEYELLNTWNEVISLGKESYFDKVKNDPQKLMSLYKKLTTSNETGIITDYNLSSEGSEAAIKIKAQLSRYMIKAAEKGNDKLFNDIYMTFTGKSYAAGKKAKPEPSIADKYIESQKNGVNGYALTAGTIASAATGGTITPILVGGAASGGLTALNATTKKTKITEQDVKQILLNTTLGAAGGGAKVVAPALGATTNRLSQIITQNPVLQSMLQNGITDATLATPIGAIAEGGQAYVDGKDAKHIINASLKGAAISFSTSFTLGAGVGLYSAKDLIKIHPENTMANGNNELNLTKIENASNVKGAADIILQGKKVKLATAGYSAPPNGYEQPTAKFLKEVTNKVGKNNIGVVTSPTADKGSIDAITTSIAQEKKIPRLYTTAEEYTGYINPENFPSSINKTAFKAHQKYVLPTGSEYSKATAEASNSLLVTGGRDATVSDFVNAIKKGNKVVITLNNELGGADFQIAKNRPNNAAAYLYDQITAFKNNQPLPHPICKGLTQEFLQNNSDKINNLIKFVDITNAEASTDAANFLLKGSTYNINPNPHSAVVYTSTILDKKNKSHNNK